MQKILKILFSFYWSLFLYMAIGSNSTIASENPVELLIGVRVDAAPFSYKRIDGPPIRDNFLAGPLKRKEYDGYVVHICDRILQQLQQEYNGQLEIKVVEINAEDRFDKLRNQQIDILCDPATITEERATDLLVSSPIYLSGISFAARPLEDFKGNHCGPIVGFVGKTTTEATGLRLILSNGEWPRYSLEITAYLDERKIPKRESSICSDTSDSKSDDSSSDPVPPVFAYNSHDELAEAFCNKKVLYYVGDYEIIARKLNQMDNCSFKMANRTYSDERYAIFATIPEKVSGKSFFILKFLNIFSREVFSHDSILIESFNRTFPGYEASRKLEGFYWTLVGDYPGRAK